MSNKNDIEHTEGAKHMDVVTIIQNNNYEAVLTAILADLDALDCIIKGVVYDNSSK